MDHHDTKYDVLAVFEKGSKLTETSEITKKKLAFFIRFKTVKLNHNSKSSLLKFL